MPVNRLSLIRRNTSTAGIELVEAVDSRRWTLGADPRFELKFHATGTADDRALRSYLLDNLPPIYEGLQLDSVDLEPVGVDSITNVGRWVVTATYQTSASDAPDTSFDSSGSVFHITQSKSTISKHGASGTPPDFKGAIGVDEKQVEGVDIIVPSYNFAEAYTFGKSLVTPAYRGSLFFMTGKVNAAPFRGFEAGEVLFLGAAGSRSGADKVRVEFRFSASPNQTNIQIGDITVAEKRGWDYIWVRYAEKEDVGGRAIVRIPSAVYVERVYDDGDFASLGIGTGPEPVAV